MQHQNYKKIRENTDNAILCITNFKKSDQLNNAITIAAHNAGCEFLFEIPAQLFGLENTNAAAVKLCSNKDNSQLAFILCDTETGIISVLSNDEAPKGVIRFVESYANVLSFFRETNITSH